MGKTKISLAVSVILIVVLAASNVWFYTIQQNQIVALKDDKNGLHDQIRILNETVNGLQNQMSQLQTDKTNLQNQISILNETKNSLESQVNQLQADKTSLQNQIESQNSTIKNLQENILFLNTQIDYFTNAARANRIFIIKQLP